MKLFSAVLHGCWKINLPTYLDRSNFFFLFVSSVKTQAGTWLLYEKLCPMSQANPISPLMSTVLRTSGTNGAMRILVSKAVLKIWKWYKLPFENLTFLEPQSMFITIKMVHWHTKKNMYKQNIFFIKVLLRYEAPLKFIMSISTSNSKKAQRNLIST